MNAFKYGRTGCWYFFSELVQKKKSSNGELIVERRQK